MQSKTESINQNIYIVFITNRPHTHKHKLNNNIKQQYRLTNEQTDNRLLPGSSLSFVPIVPSFPSGI